MPKDDNPDNWPANDLRHLQRARHPEVYRPGEPLPQPGKRERFFGSGLWPTIITLIAAGFVYWLVRWTGVPAAVGRLVRDFTADFLR